MAKPKPAPPLKAADKSEWVVYAMDVHGLASYDAWNSTLDDLYALVPPEPKKPTPKARPTHG